MTPTTRNPWLNASAIEPERLNIGDHSTREQLEHELSQAIRSGLVTPSFKVSCQRAVQEAIAKGLVTTSDQ